MLSALPLQNPSPFLCSRLPVSFLTVDSLSAEQEMLIDDVVDTSLIPEYYNPVISDPIKALVSYNHADAIIRNPSKYFTLWIQLGISYPGRLSPGLYRSDKRILVPRPGCFTHE